MNSLVATIALLVGQIVGSEFVYTVQPGDSLTGIGARFGADARVLAKANELKSSGNLKIGKALKIDNRHIAPAATDVAIIINVPQRMLFRLGADGTVQGYPIAAGSSGWETPLGEFSILTKETDPTWDVPVSIQEEMRRSGKPVLTCVPPSPENPLGKYWIGLSLPSVGIHGTNAPASIYSLSTHGCIRLHPNNIESFFPQVAVGMRGRIIYEPVLVSHTQGSVFLEVHPDPYKKGTDPLSRVMDRARSEGFLDMVDLTLVEEVIRKRDGIARDVTRR